MRKESIILVLAIAVVGLLSLGSANAAAYAYPVEVTDTNFLPATIYAGDFISLKVSVYNKNNSVPVTDINATLDIGGEFEAIDLTDSIDVLAQRTTKVLLFKFRCKEGTVPGYYPAMVSIDYVIEGDVSRETHSVQIPVSMARKNLDVLVSPNVINPGKQTDVSFTISNIGETPVSNISFSWTEANDLVLPLGSDNKRYVSLLEGGKQVEVSYIVAADPNIEPGIYPLDISMTFSDVDGTKTQTSQVGLIIGGGTDFEISAEMSSANQLSISIANVGSNNAGAVVVRIPEQEGIRISGSNAAILGNLNEGDYTLASFQLAGARMGSIGTTGTTGAMGGRQRWTGAQATPPQEQDTKADQEGEGQLPRGPRQLKIEIDYTDTTGERQSLQKTVEIDLDFASMQSAFTGTMQAQGFDIMDYWQYIVVAVVAVAVIVYYRKRKKRD